MNWLFQSDLPIYSQLIHGITQGIVAGDFNPGERLPSVRELASEAGVNPNTMQRALTELERIGLVHSQRTAGRFVTEDENMIQETKKGLAREQIKGFVAAMISLGYTIQDIIDLIQEEEKGEELKCLS
ncbi:MAG: GntR family transcriptional regulator [Evtepia sp.]